MDNKLLVAMQVSEDIQCYVSAVLYHKTLLDTRRKDLDCSGMSHISLETVNEAFERIKFFKGLMVNSLRNLAGDKT